jgi:DNA-binding transcriptional LysR family regulator
MNLLSSLRYLVALNEHKHFGRAAKACHITQPALSNALRALEQEFSVTIVRRDRNYVGLTPEGEKVLASAQRMLHEHESLAQELRSATSVPTGLLRIAAVPSAVPVAALFAARLQAKHIGIVPRVLSMSSRDLEQGLLDLSLDLAFGYSDRIKPDSELLAIAQYTEQYFFVRHQTNVAVVGAKMSWQEASASSLCLLTPDMYNRSIIDATFASIGLTVKPVIETNSILALMLSVIEGNVSGVLPGALVGAMLGSSLGAKGSAIEALSLNNPEVLAQIGFMTHGAVRPSIALEAATALANDPVWLKQASAYSELSGTSFSF